MTITQIEQRVAELAQNPPQQPDQLFYQLILAYDTPNATVARLQKGSLNVAKHKDEILWKGKAFFKHVTDDSRINAELELAKQNPDTAKQKPRFLLITSPQHLRAWDTKLLETLDTPIAELHRYFDFFLPLVGMEKAQYQVENPADVKAAEKMSKLYDQITKDNPAAHPDDTHALNVFLSRLLFCFFAEDTAIFQSGQFTNAIQSHTQDDGSDLAPYLERLFVVLNTPERNNLPAFLEAFPYVNGGLFRGNYAVPAFTRRSRSLLLECGTLDWAAINPDIFGSMIQAVVDPAHRGGLGMHYTSVPNIMKVIKPLFLDELIDIFIAIKGNKAKLIELHRRICKIRVFDPACGSGNFLIIAYKELRLLEIQIFKELGEFAFSGISLDQFYGIELDDFAHEIALLSLWLAEHQMNRQFVAELGRAKPALPLNTSGHIVHGNATRLDWTQVCPHPTDGGEVFILGNPPYLGSYVQNKAQKDDLAFAAKGFSSYKDLDYICCWFILAARYITGFNAKFSFVTTNSICQGEQVTLLWPYVFKQNLEISFAYQSFKWGNNAKFNAGVYCTIIGVENKINNNKKLFFDDKVQYTNSISPYLTSGSTLIIDKRMKPLSQIPKMNYGSKIVDNGHLIFTTEEKNNLIFKNPEADILFRKFVGSAEFIQGRERWCLYIKDENLEIAFSISEIVERLERVKEFRLNSSERSTVESASNPHKYYYSVHNDSNSIIVPRTSSERRSYIPIGFLDKDSLISDAANAIYDAEPWIFAILTSKMHMNWVSTVGGRLKMDYRYSTQLCYNTFPLPPLSAEQKKQLQAHTFAVLAAREEYPERTLAQLYDPEKMPDQLRAAHQALDLAVEQCYRPQPFGSDEERLEYLFKLYETMLAEEKSRGTLFAAGAKKSKTKN